MGDAFVATREMRQDAPPCWISQGRESPIECLWRIFNHLVNYLTDIYRNASAKICVSALREQAAGHVQRLAVAPALFRVRPLSRCKHLFGRSVLRISEAAGREFKYVDVPEDAARDGMLQAGLPQWQVEPIMELHAINKQSRWSAVTSDIENVT